MRVAKIESVEGIVQVVSGSAVHEVKNGDSVQLNELLLTGNSSACTLVFPDGSVIQVPANHKILVDQDVSNLEIDSETEAVTNIQSFMQAAVQLALSDSDTSLSQVLNALTDILNQSTEQAEMGGSVFTEDHSLFLMLDDEKSLGYDLLAGSHIDEKEAELLSLEEALTGDSVPVAESSDILASDKQSLQQSLSKADLKNLIDSGSTNLQVEELIQQLAQVVDLSGYFSNDWVSEPSLANLELNAQLDDEDIIHYDSI